MHTRDQFEWDDLDDIYHREKYGYKFDKINSYRDDLEEIALMIRNDLTNKRISVTVNNYMQIVVRLNLNNVETMHSVAAAMEELNNIRVTYLSDFDTANFEMSMERDNPTIFCYYERI